MKVNIHIEDLTLRGQLSKMKCGYGDDRSWTSLSDKELKNDFIKTLNYYRENKSSLSKHEKDYLKQLEEINTIVFGKEDL